MSEPGVIRGYFLTIKNVLIHPRHFFREMPVTGGMGGPLAFGLVTHWIGSAIYYLEEIWLGAPLSGFFKSLFETITSGTSSFYRYTYETSGDFSESSRFLQLKDRIYDWFMGAGPVVVDPFFTLFSTLFTAFFVFIGARILVSYPPSKFGRRGVSYESVVRISCYCLAPSLLLAIPIFGKVIASLYAVVLLVIATQEVFQVGIGRSLVIAFFPRILFFGILFAGFFLVLLVLFNLFAMFF